MINLKALANLERFLLTKPVGKDIPLTVGETVKAKVEEILSSGSIVLKIKDGYITVKSDLQLQKNQELLLKVLFPKENKVQFELISIDGNVLKEKPSLEPRVFNLQNDLTKILQQLKILAENNKLILNGIKNPEKISSNDIKNSIQNSGIFFENKIYNFFKLTTELRNKLPEVKEINMENYKEKINQIKSQINDSEIQEKLDSLEKSITSIKEDLKLNNQDYKVLEPVKNLQILSLLTDSVYGVFNLTFPSMRIGNFEIKKVKHDDEDVFYFKGSLDFEDGKVDFLVARFKDGYFISIKPENPEFKENMKKLKNELLKSLTQSDIKVVSLDVF